MTGMWFASAVRCELPELKPQCTVAARSTSKASTPSVTRDYVSQLAGYVLRDIPRCSPVLPSKQHDHQHKRDQGQDQGQDQGHHRQRLSTTSVSLPRPSTQPGLLGQASARAANRVVAKTHVLPLGRHLPEGPALLRPPGELALTARELVS
jgi:hypothetical protein